MANHVIQRVENQIVVQPLVAVPLTDLYSQIGAIDEGLATEILARTATDVEVAEVRVIAEAAITQAQLDATVIEVASSSDAGLNALDAALSADISAEAVARAAADSAEVIARTAAVAAEASARIAGIAAEATLRAAAVTAETNARNTQVNAEALARAEVDDEIYAALAAQGDAVYAAIEAGDIAEGAARDTAIGVGLNALSVELTEDIVLKSDRYVEGLTGGLKGDLVPAFSRARMDLVGFFFSAGSFQSWAFGFVPSRRMTPGGLILYPADVASVDYLLVQVLRRPVANAGNGLPPNATNDTVIDFATYPKATWLNPDTAASGAHRAVLDLSSLDLGPFTPDYRYAFRVYGFNASNVQVNIGYAQAINAPNTNPVWERGYYEIGGTQTAMGTVEALAWAFLELVGQDAGSPSLKAALPQSVARAEMQAFWPTSAGGANLADTVIHHAAGQAAIPGQLAVFTAPATTTVTAEPITLQYNQEINLAHQNVAAGSVVFTKTAGSVVLVEGVDYQIDYDQASIKGLINVADIPGTIAYTGRKSRVDVIYADPITQVVGIASGTDRGTDATEFIPAVPDGKVEIARAYVTVADGVDILDRRRFNGFVPQGGEAEHAAWLEISRDRLPKTFRAMTSGQDIALIGYGDSITEQGSTSDYYVANGTGRDKVVYLQAGRIGSDVIAALPLHNQGDGAGSVHTRVGWNWTLKDAIEGHSGSRVPYYNSAIGGTRSSNDAPGGKPNATDPTRLAALLALVDAQIALGRVALVSLAFGMNELGLSITRANLASLIRDIQSHGGEVLLWGVPIFARDGGFSTIAEWRETNRQIGQAAEDTKVAVVPLWRIADPDNIAGLGIPWRAACSANGTNHPGPYELRRYGEFASLIFGGAVSVQTVSDYTVNGLANAIPSKLTLARRVISGTTGTITAADAGLVIECLNGSPTTITVPNDQVEGFHCRVRQVGGAITFTAGSGATLRSLSGAFVTSGQWSEVELSVRGNSTGVVADWVLTGDI